MATDVAEALKLVKKGDFFDLAVYLRQYMPDELHQVLFDFISGRLTHAALLDYLGRHHATNSTMES